MNQKAITSLTLGIMSLFIPVVGLVLGIIGLVFANGALKSIYDTSEEGKKAAVAGKVCSIVGICIQIGVIVLFLLGSVFFFSVN
ncbi:DUF4190 domain-containing protein [Halobacillus sp. BBL2006]|uniref:DUF4190 domain-containing protein n=1 Tax=Halobacillus sp. BBL2006 TaxID=1543706 RepID=UPI000542E306|nr:DUF4190 domain-containing protein [Halobacillus sp. BBL2006]KHE68859.1 hypothetical protein LD39_13825 [Halobacillus sp. BBL2006]